MNVNREEKSPRQKDNSPRWMDVGGDDPDFVPMPASTPVLCRIPGLKSLLPHCQS